MLPIFIHLVRLQYICSQHKRLQPKLMLQSFPETSFHNYKKDPREVFIAAKKSFWKYSIGAGFSPLTTYIYHKGFSRNLCSRFSKISFHNYKKDPREVFIAAKKSFWKYSIGVGFSLLITYIYRKRF